MRSLSEIETTSKRASRAAGFSWGISEEVGKSIRLLELFGLPGIKNLNQYFKEKNLKNFENLKLITEENHPKTSAYCPINLGVCFLDQIQTMETYEKFSFKHIAYPLLLLPFLSRCSELIGKRILFNFDDKKFLLNFNFVDNKDNFSELEWKNLYKLSEQTFVEERDSLKQGAAGAGLTDND